jgi:hypothetical protein
MVLKSFSGFCCTGIHLVAFACAIGCIYFFLGSFENVLVAIVLFSLALGLEGVAAVIAADRHPIHR